MNIWGTRIALIHVAIQGPIVTRLFSVEWKLLTQKSDSFWFLNQRHEWVQWALKNHSKIWFWLNPFDSFWFNQPNGLPEKSSDLCHSQVLFWESKGISYSTDDSFIHGESNYWVNDSELKTAYLRLRRILTRRNYRVGLPLGAFLVERACLESRC